MLHKAGPNLRSVIPPMREKITALGIGVLLRGVPRAFRALSVGLEAPASAAKVTSRTLLILRSATPTTDLVREKFGFGAHPRFPLLIRSKSRKLRPFVGRLRLAVPSS